MGFYTTNGGKIGTGEILEKDGVFDQKTNLIKPIITTVRSTQAYQSGVMAGGTSQTNVTSQTQSIGLSSANYSSNRRYVIALFGFRDSGGALTNNRTPQVNTVTLGGVALTKLDEGHSDFNSSIIAAGFVSRTGTQNFTFTFNNSISGGAGYVSLLVFDRVDGVSFASKTYSASSSTGNVIINSSSDIPAGIAGTGRGQTVRVIGLNASNPSTAPTWTASDGFTYASWFSQDNGTTEFSVGLYHISTIITGTQNSISGTVGGVTAGQGKGFIGADFKMFSYTG
jgi:hypothetical protein